MTRRGWWLVLLNFLLPGSAQVARRQPPPRPLRSRRDAARCGSSLILGSVSPLLWPAVGVSVVIGAWIPDWLAWFRWLPLTICRGCSSRYARAVGRADDRHPAPGPTRQARAPSRVRHRRRLAVLLLVGASGGAAVRRESRRCGAGHARRDSSARAGPSVPPSRRLLQHPAARRRQRRGPRLDAVRQHLRRLGQRRHGRRRRSPASRATCRTSRSRAGPMQDQYPDGHEGHADAELRMGQRHQPAAHRGRGLPGRQHALPRRGGQRLRRPASRRPRMPRRASSASRSRTTSSSTCTASRRSSMRSAASTSPSRSVCPKGGGPVLPRPAGRGMGHRLDRAGDAAHGRRHRAVVRAIALHDRRLRPHEAPAPAAGGDPRAVHPADRPHPLPGRRGRGHRHRSRPTCRSRSLPSLADLALKAKEQPVTTIELTPAGGSMSTTRTSRTSSSYMQQTLHPPTPTPSRRAER